MMSSSFRRLMQFAALCGLSGVILWWLGRKLDWQEVIQAISHSNSYLLGTAVLIACLLYLLQAYRWSALLGPLGSTRLNHLLAATTIGLCAMFLLGRLGEVVRPVVLPLRDPKVRVSASFLTLMIEKIYDLLAIVFLFGANLLWFRPPNRLEGEWSRVRIA